MGLDINRFVLRNKIGHEFICSICKEVIHKPKQINSVCEHIFCYQCISFLVENQKILICPNDRNPIKEPYFERPSRYWFNNYSKLKIKCFYNTNGCKTALHLEDIDKHELSCEHNPEAIVICSKGCAAQIPRQQLKGHECIAHLKSLIDDLSLSTPQSQTPQLCGSVYDEIKSIKTQINDLKKKLDQIIERFNERLPEKGYAVTKNKSDTSQPLLDLDNDSTESAVPRVLPRRIDSSFLQSIKLIQPKVDLTNI